jgi:hypothetical protein
METDMDERKLEQVEQLLRSHGPARLGPQFQREVLAAIAQLPAPALTAPPRPASGWRYAWQLLSTGEKLGLGLLGLGLAACLVVLLIPGAFAWFALAGWELNELTLSVSLGESVASASLVSVLAVLGLAGFMAGIGTFSARNHLLGA